MFDPEGSTGRLHACPFVFWERVVRCFMGRSCAGKLDEATAFFVATFAGVVRANHLRRVYRDRSLFSSQLGCIEYTMPRYGSWKGNWMSGVIGSQG